MKSFNSLEQDVYDFLSNLAYVRKVEIAVSVTDDGRKKVKAKTFVVNDKFSNWSRVNQTEQLLKERHKNVIFDFTVVVLKDTKHERSLESAQA